MTTCVEPMSHMYVREKTIVDNKIKVVIFKCNHSDAFHLAYLLLSCIFVVVVTYVSSTSENLRSEYRSMRLMQGKHTK